MHQTFSYLFYQENRNASLDREIYVFIKREILMNKIIQGFKNLLDVFMS